nr:hypothetical protein [Methylococcus capsulatus]
MSCGTSCSSASASFASGSMVTLTASPFIFRKFTGWSGDCTGTSRTCTVLMDRARTVNATFQ